MTPSRTAQTHRLLPTERLTLVLGEATQALSLSKSLRTTIAQILRDWGTMPQEAIIMELREALDNANSLPPPSAIPEALAYLKVNSRRLMSSRNRQRRDRALPMEDFDPLAYLPQDEGLPPPPQRNEALPPMSLDDIEAKLKALGGTETGE